MGKNESRLSSIPIIKLGNNKFYIKIDTRIYSKDVINSTCYKFLNIHYIYQQINNTDSNFIDVIFESKNNNSLEIDLKNFCNELIDQQVRFDINLKFGHIRDMIVEEAFKPVSK